MRKFFGFLFLITSGFLILTCLFVSFNVLFKINNHNYSQAVGERLGYVVGYIIAQLVFMAALVTPAYFLIKKGVKLIQS